MFFLIINDDDDDDDDDDEKYYYSAVKIKLELYSSEWLRSKKNQSLKKITDFKML